MSDGDRLTADPRFERRERDAALQAPGARTLTHKDTNRPGGRARVHLQQKSSLRSDETLLAEYAHAQRLAALGASAAMVAHEFNNILTPLLSYAQLALASPDDQQLAHDALMKVVESASRATNMADAILTYSKPNLDCPAETSLSDAVEGALACMARSPQQDGIGVAVHADPTIRAAIQPIALQQIILNLVLNAVEAMTPGGGHLAISAQRSTWNTPPTWHGSPRRLDEQPLARMLVSNHHHDGAVVITITDTGRGIEPEDLDKIFDPFFSRRAPEHVKGTGLGLSMCRRLVEAAGGWIAVASEPGQGTTFTITLPTAESSATIPVHCPNSTRSAA